MVSGEMQNVISLLRKSKGLGNEKIDIQELRDGLEQLAEMLEVPDDVKYDSVDAGGVPAEWVSTPDTAENRAILYLHGGGWVAGSLKTHRELVARISRATKTRVLLIDYRLAPEYPFPEGLNDCINAYKWILSKGITSENLVIAGDSAGGNLAIASLLKLRDDGIPLPASAICLSPVTDATLSGESYKTKAELDPSVTKEGMAFNTRNYVKTKDLQNPLVSPLFADLRGLPPLLIHVGTAEILHDDSTRFAQRAKEAGVDVTLEIFQDMGHVFHIFAAWAPEGQQGIEKIAKFLLKIEKGEP